MNLEEARRNIAIARRHLHRVQDASFEIDEDDPELGVTFAFYAYECCIVALAELHGIPWTKNHARKAQLARDLYARELVSRDIGDELQNLNELRKDVAYSEPGPELQQVDLTDLAFDLEEFIDEVESQVKASS